MVLCTVGDEGERRRSNTEVLDWLFLDDKSLLCLSCSPWASGQRSLTSPPSCLPAGWSKPCSAEPWVQDPGHEDPRTEPSSPKFLSRASRRSKFRLEAAAIPAETAETWASWMIANFSRSNLLLWSFGESSSITDATIESAKDA